MRYNKPMLKRIYYGVLSTGLFVAQKAFAACPVGQICNPLNANSFSEVVNKVKDLIIEIGSPIAIMFIIYSGFLFVAARGNEKKLEEAKETFKWTIIGTALIIGGAAIAAAVVDFAKKL